MEKKHITNKTKLLLSFLGIELILFLFVILSANQLIPLSNSKLLMLFIISILMFGTGFWLYLENKEYYKKHEKKFHVLFTLILLIIPMLFAGYIRSYAYNLPVADKWAESTIVNRITPQIYNQVKAEYPNLPEDLVNTEVSKRYETFLTENFQDVESEKQKLATELRNQFQGDNGQTYFLAIDPYYYYTTSNLLYKNDYIGDKLVDDVPVITRRLAPVGAANTQVDFHTWLEAKLYSLNNLNDTSSAPERMKAVYFLPALFSMLAIIPLFFIVKKYSSNLFAFFASLSLASVSTFLSRTQAGFVDTDVYNILFPLLIMLFIILGLNSKDLKSKLTYGFLAGLTQIFFLWAWGNGWFVFLFVLVALIGYILYTMLAELIEKNKIKQIAKRLETELYVSFSFLISTVVFGFIFNKNILKSVFVNLINLDQGILSAQLGKIWPNVYSSVAELNPASFTSVIDAIGGKLIFFIALMGLLLLSLDFTNKHEKYNLYKYVLISISTVWFIFFILPFKEMGLLETIHNSLIALTSNTPFMFLVLLFLPIGVGLLFSLHNTNADKKTFLTILLSVYMFGTIYMSFQGVRFVLLLAPAFAIAFGVGLFYLYKLISKGLEFTFELNEKNSSIKIYSTLIILILFGWMFIPQLTMAHEIGMSSVPNFDDAWYNLMYKIKDNSSENAIITSWWDFGHFFIAISERGATFDGASQTTPASHWVGKLLMENDEQVSLDILKMLVCGNNQAFEIMLEKTNDSTDGVLINKVLYDTFGVEDKFTVLKQNKYFEFSDSDVNEILEKLDCENPPENYVIASQDMVGKTGVWAHWGSWDFTKKYVLDHYKNSSPEKMAELLDEDQEKILLLVTELKEIDMKARLKNIKREDLVNQWLAPYPNYLSDWISCTKENNLINCQNVLTIDVNTKKATFIQKQGGEIANLVYVENKTLSTFKQVENGVFDVILVNDQNNVKIMLAQNPLGASFFTKLYFLNGIGTSNLTKFDYTQSTVGWDIHTWKVNS